LKSRRKVSHLSTNGNYFYKKITYFLFERLNFRSKFKKKKRRTDIYINGLNQFGIISGSSSGE